MPTDFSSLRLSTDLLTVLEELSYTQMTPVQEQALPPLLEGKDVLGQSKTGSGKTVAFALPILQKLELPGRRLQALVLCPTRELCAQVAREIRRLGRRHAGLQVLVVSGGESGRHQARALAKGVHVVVGTPGRILDHLGRDSIDLSAATTAVLDEADRMLDMGFQKDVEKILSHLPKPRQTLLFSATMPPAIASLSRSYQKDAVRITIEEPKQAQLEIRQIAYFAEAPRKFQALCRALDEHLGEQALIFCNTKVTVAELTDALQRAGVSAACLHGDLEQFDRDQVLARFRNESIRLLIATDVAARGLDVEDLELVINYQIPSQPETYLHRIGRTGRAGKAGLALSIATSREERRLEAAEKTTGQRIEWIEQGKGTAPAKGALPKTLLRPAKMATLHIGGGRRDKLRPGDILGALTGEAGGLKAADIGKIEIQDRLSYVAVSKSLSRDAAKNLNQGRLKGRRFRTTLVEPIMPS